MRVFIRLSLIVSVLFLVPAVGQAVPLVVNYSNAQYGLAASAQFDVSGTDLIITLSNTSPGDPSRAADILTGLFFNVLNDPSLAAKSAVICSTCEVTNDGPTQADGGVGGEWGYRHNAAGLAFGDSYGLSSTSLGSLFTDKSVTWPSAKDENLFGTVSPGGVDYGITTKYDADDNDTSNKVWQPLIRNQVIFTLSGLGANFTLGDITNVNFQYGTSLNTPEPATFGLMVMGLGLLAGVRGRKSRRA